MFTSRSRNGIIRLVRSLARKEKSTNEFPGFYNLFKKKMYPCLVEKVLKKPRYGELESSTHGSQVPLPETVWNCARWLISWGNTSRFAHVRSSAQRSASTLSTRRVSTNVYDVTSYSQAANRGAPCATFAMYDAGTKYWELSMGSTCRGTVIQ